MTVSPTRRLLEWLFRDLSAPPGPGRGWSRGAACPGAFPRVGDLLPGPRPGAPLRVRDALALGEPTRPLASHAGALVLIALIGVFTFLAAGSPGRLSASIATAPRTETIPSLLRCTGHRELELALTHARSLGVTRGTVSVRAPALWDALDAPASVTLAEDASTSEPPRRVDLTLLGEPIADVDGGIGDEMADAPDPARLVRYRATARGVTVSLARLTGTQVHPVDSAGAVSVWQYAVRATGRGPLSGVRSFLADLHGAGWAAHVDALDVTFDGRRCEFRLDALLLCRARAGAARAGAGHPGQRRLMRLAGSEEASVSPRGAVALARLDRFVAVVTPLVPGPATIAVRGALGPRTIPLAIAEAALDAEPDPFPEPEPPARARRDPPPREAPPRETSPPEPAPREPPPPAPARTSPPPDFPQLLGTSATRPGARALFAEKNAREGDRVGAFKVVEVLEDGVRLSWSGRRFFLPVSGSPREEMDVSAAQDNGSSNAERR
jgi:hypothetical protein